jgi:transmembrane sensor
MLEINPEILSKYLEGKASDQENQAAEAWMEENDINKELLGKFLNPSNGVRTMLELEPSRDWEKVRKEIWGGKVLHFSILKIAASILIALLVGFMVYRFTTPEEVLAFKTVTNTTGDVQTLAMEDGSVLYLNRGASVVFPEKFKSNRNVRLTGETFFDVKRDETHPFVIAAGRCEVRVLGTSFSINADTLDVEVAVKSGKVSFGSDENNKIILLKDDLAVFDAASSRILKTVNDNPNTFAWQTHVLVFENTSFEHMIRDLEKYFRVQISVFGDVSRVPGYTSRFDHPSLTEVLDEMKLILDVDYKIENNKVIIRIPA